MDNVTLRYVGFDFPALFNFLQEVIQNSTDPLQSPYLQQGQAGSETYLSLTHDVCLAITGSWALYEQQDIWNRIVTWKLPLLTLLFQFSRPPFAFRLWTNTNVFMLVHLVGNPINTIASLLATLDACQRRATEIRQRIEAHQRHSGKASPWRRTAVLWKRFTIIDVSYAEWGVANARPFLQRSLDQLLRQPDARIAKHFSVAAAQLAADRATYALPVVVAQLSFVVAIGAAYWRVAGVPPQPHAWTNVEAYSIAMSAPFLHALPVVFLAAIVGATQTETSAPRILNALRERLVSDGWEEVLARNDGGAGGGSMVDTIPLPRTEEIQDREEDTEEQDSSGSDELAEPAHNGTPLELGQRIASGCLYAWRADLLAPTGANMRQHASHMALATTFVALSVAVAQYISYGVPPAGLDCRSGAQAALLGAWAGMFGCDFVLACLFPNKNRLYNITFAKDAAAALAVVTLIVVTQLGIFNQCACYTAWGAAPLALPQLPAVAKVLTTRIARDWPAATFLWIGMELLLCVFAVGVRYRDALRVYLQRDDGSSNGGFGRLSGQTLFELGVVGQG
ncbi:hypothetical protein B0T24DRAFT_664495 [Lasiosphaeria ovina]|uniref:Uncharacterized protein n=1 Tax=Lasiosphaeria ovina TaxID=92902 RepID=A0AAE0NFD9_9PEZI|nr:hypothetical protein B0T24DRAFT_664495 [Lasiosphaeria ovina]